ncbi:MAG: SAM-dependent methyltransferase [Muribaculum sp.]|nr:SAM-dependent methyltransferase [Muribaculum sp.]
MLQSALYLIPVGISEAPLDSVIPAANIEVINDIRYFIVENVRTARRFLRKVNPKFDIDGSTFYELNGHTDLSQVSSYLEPLRQGKPMGVMSEAGCPAVADPGALPVSIAQREGLKVAPLVGPSSILLSLMASGFNGQGFSFHGYLPIDEGSRTKRIRELEAQSARNDMTQIFIETPYRNNKMIAFLARTLRADTKLCVACDITDPQRETVITRPAAKWRDCKENYDKRPAIFLIYCR